MVWLDLKCDSELAICIVQRPTPFKVFQIQRLVLTAQNCSFCTAQVKQRPKKKGECVCGGGTSQVATFELKPPTAATCVSTSSTSLKSLASYSASRSLLPAMMLSLPSTLCMNSAHMVCSSSPIRSNFSFTFRSARHHRPQCLHTVLFTYWDLNMCSNALQCDMIG